MRDLKVQTTSETTTIPAIRKTYSVTIPASRIQEFAFREAAREFCLDVADLASVRGEFNSDGSIFITGIVITHADAGDGFKGMRMGETAA